MYRTRLWFLLIGTALLLTTSAIPAAQTSGEKERLTAIAVVNNPGRSGAGIVLIDIDMPAGEGLEAVAAIRVGERTRGMPIVGISDAAEPTPAEVAQALDGCIAKPIDTAHLLASVGRVLEEAARKLQAARDNADPAGAGAEAAPRPVPKRA